MRKSSAARTAISAIALAATLTGCGATLRKTGLATGKDGPDFAVASRAHVALASGDYASAVQLAERAVEVSPNDPLVRTLLGDSYFASGRFASAEAAFRDSLSLAPNQAKLMLKLALVQIAQGKNSEAFANLQTARPALDPADYGLAAALSGQTDAAIEVLEYAARHPQADSRVRQNLALAHGLAGNWEAAKIIAGQDLSGAMVDQRVQQWMAFAKPLRASDQVAALTGVTPAYDDPGQPVRLALNGADATRLAVAPVTMAPYADAHPVAPVPVQLAEAVPPLPAYEPVAVADQAPLATPAPAYVPPVLADLEASAPKSAPVAEAAVKLAEVRKPVAAAKQSPMPKRSIDNGIVVQLGAYSSPKSVEAAWETASDRYASLRSYTPTSARFNSDKGVVYRLAVKGFASNEEARDFCAGLKRKGKSCFVRQTAGDSPVRFASR